MDEIEVLIKIPKEDYEFIYDEFADGDMPDGKSLTRTTLYAIAKGTVLPKGHGRLIEADEVSKGKFHFECECDCAVCSHSRNCECDLINSVPTVIEADKEAENG